MKCKKTLLSLLLLSLASTNTSIAAMTVTGNTGNLSINTPTFSDPLNWLGLTINGGDALDFELLIDESIADSNSNSEFGVYFGAIQSVTFSVGAQIVSLNSLSTNIIEIRNTTNTDFLSFFFGDGGDNLQLDFTANSTISTGPFLSDQLNPLGGVGANQFSDADFNSSRSLLSVAGGGSTAAFSVNSESATITTVPEPSSVFLLGLGTLSLAVVRRRVK